MHSKDLLSGTFGVRKRQNALMKHRVLKALRCGDTVMMIVTGAAENG